MQTWLNFFIFLFWLTFLGFIFNPTNFVFLLVYSEITWITLYCYAILVGTLIDDLNSFTLSFLILGLAGVEFSLGYLLIILFRNFNKTLNFTESDFMWYSYLYKNAKKLSSIKSEWNVK